jgi:hypothetical protein
MVGIFSPRQNKSPDDFWREYEEKTGEQIIARSLGQYVSGWDEFGDSQRNPIWGLIIATSGGFRFHHFPQVNWISALTGFGRGEMPKEKTFFIPREKIISANLIKETRWYRKIISPNVPRLLVRYLDQKGAQKDLLFYAEYKSDGIAEAITKNSEP